MNTGMLKPDPIGRGKRVRRRRKELDLTQAQLAELVSAEMMRQGIGHGIRQQAIGDIERGEVRNTNALEAIANVLGVSPAWLQWGTDRIEKWPVKALQLADTAAGLSDADLELLLATAKRMRGSE